MIRILALSVTAILVCIDQLTKAWALESLRGVQQVVVIPGIFNLTYVENRGAAFGIFQNRTQWLAVFSGIVVVAVLFALISGRIKSKFLVWSVSLVLAGGVGNLIDRVYRGFVVDLFDFSAFFDFPVFNFADCCVVVGTVMILVNLFWNDWKQHRAAKAAKEA